jgi:hypothetical protein
MIGMAVRNQNVIGANCFDVDRFGQGIRRDKGIEEKRLASRLNRETGMAVVGNFHIGLLYENRVSPIRLRSSMRTIDLRLTVSVRISFPARGNSFRSTWAARAGRCKAWRNGEGR